MPSEPLPSDLPLSSGGSSQVGSATVTSSASNGTLPGLLTRSV